MPDASSYGGAPNGAMIHTFVKKRLTFQLMPIAREGSFDMGGVQSDPTILSSLLGILLGMVGWRSFWRSRLLLHRPFRKGGVLQVEDWNSPHGGY